MVTPVDVIRYEQLLQISGNDKTKSEDLIAGFREGFSLGYHGNMKVKRMA